MRERPLFLNVIFAKACFFGDPEKKILPNNVKIESGAKKKAHLPTTKKNGCNVSDRRKAVWFNSPRHDVA